MFEYCQVFQIFSLLDLLLQVMASGLKYLRSSGSIFLEQLANSIRRSTF